jgi:hypothetical protein
MSASQGKTGYGLYPDGMVELDGYVGQQYHRHPFERGDESILYDKWTADRVFVHFPCKPLLQSG